MDTAPLYTFGILADPHIKRGGHSAYYDRVADYTNSERNYSRALETLGKYGVSFVALAGDIGCDGAGPTYGCDRLYPDDLLRFKELTDAYNRGAAHPLKLYTCRGDHDFGWDAADWDTYVSSAGASDDFTRSLCPENPATFSVRIHGDLFIFLSMDDSERASGIAYADPYSHSVFWAAAQLKASPGRRVFLFSHLPLSSVGQRKEHECIVADAKYLPEFTEEVLKHGNVILVSGHTHKPFETAEFFPDIIFAQKKDGTAYVNVPSCGYESMPVSADINAPYSTYRKSSDLPEGFIVRVYPDKVLFTGINLLTGETLTEFRSDTVSSR